MKVRIVATLAVAATALAVAASPAGASTTAQDPATPVLLLHGHNVNSAVNCDDWNGVDGALRGAGRTGDVVKVGIYAGDVNCTDRLEGYGRTDDQNVNHQEFFGKGAGAAYDNDIPIEHLGYNLAWMIYRKYSSQGRTVDAVGFSMGGLVLRYALWMTQEHNPYFPPYLLVEDAVTLGTPHEGAATSNCASTGAECLSMDPNSALMSAMNDPNRPGRNPQGLGPDGNGRTEWTLEASEADGVVPVASAAGLTVDGRPGMPDVMSKVVYGAALDLHHVEWISPKATNRGPLVYRNLATPPVPDNSGNGWPGFAQGFSPAEVLLQALGSSNF